MDDGGPYRQGPAWRACPRCEEVLEENFPGGLICPRCAGSWISQVVLDAAFGDPLWPNGAAMWWRRSLDCPECASGGKQVVMDAIEAHGVIVDRCAGHGMWFDGGELERVIDVAGDPYAVLCQHMALSRPEIEAARARYDRRRAQASADRQAARTEAELAERRAEEQEAAARRAREELAAVQTPARRELVQAIATKEAELLAVRRRAARLESDLGELNDRLRQLTEA